MNQEISLRVDQIRNPFQALAIELLIFSAEVLASGKVYLLAKLELLQELFKAGSI